MPKIRYSAKENKRVGTLSYYAQAIPTGKLSFRELCEEACEDNTYSIEEMTGCVSRFMNTLQPYIKPQTSVKRLKGDLELPEEMIINGVLYRRVRESED